MKSVFLISAAATAVFGAALNAQAKIVTKKADFVECGAIAGVEEWRVGIDLKSGRAGFFDNGATASLKYSRTRMTDEAPARVQKIYTGKGLMMIFTPEEKSVALFSIGRSKSELIGKSEEPCRSAAPWDDL